MPTACYLPEAQLYDVERIPKDRWTKLKTAPFELDGTTAVPFDMKDYMPGDILALWNEFLNWGVARNTEQGKCHWTKPPQELETNAADDGFSGGKAGRDANAATQC